LHDKLLNLFDSGADGHVYVLVSNVNNHAAHDARVHLHHTTFVMHCKEQYGALATPLNKAMSKRIPYRALSYATHRLLNQQILTRLQQLLCSKQSWLSCATSKSGTKLL